MSVLFDKMKSLLGGGGGSDVTAARSGGPSHVPVAVADEDDAPFSSSDDELDLNDEMPMFIKVLAHVSGAMQSNCTCDVALTEAAVGSCCCDPPPKQMAAPVPP